MFTIIIPYFNEEKYIHFFIESLKKLDLIDLAEIILIDGCSTDKSTDIIRDELYLTNLNYRIICNPKRIVPISLNMAIKTSTGSPIIRLDVHTFYPSDYISKLLNEFGKLKAMNIGGVSIASSFSGTEKGKIISVFLKSKFGVGNASFRTGLTTVMETDTAVYGCYDRAVFSKIGYFNEKLERNQDIEFNSRIREYGFKIYTVPTVESFYFPGDSFRDFVKKNFYNGLWNAKTVRITKKLKALQLRHFVPLVFFMYVLLIAPAFIFFGYYIFIPILIYSFLGFYSSRSSGLTIKNILIFIGLSFICHLSYGFGSMVGLFRKAA